MGLESPEPRLQLFPRRFATDLRLPPPHRTAVNCDSWWCMSGLYEEAQSNRQRSSTSDALPKCWGIRSTFQHLSDQLQRQAGLWMAQQIKWYEATWYCGPEVKYQTLSWAGRNEIKHLWRWRCRTGQVFTPFMANIYINMILIWKSISLI